MKLSLASLMALRRGLRLPRWWAMFPSAIEAHALVRYRSVSPPSRKQSTTIPRNTTAEAFGCSLVESGITDDAVAKGTGRKQNQCCD